MKKIYTEEEIRTIAISSIGKTFKELKNINPITFTSENYDENEDKLNKAYFGHIFEQDVYGYDINSNSEPDFIDANIELKVTPYKKNKDNSLSAKERLVLNIINYMTEYKNEFFSSHFWYKNKKIQIIWYLYEPNKNKNEFIVTNELLYTFPKEDLQIIKKDWETIINKIKQGKAHEISEADTMYLGACTKGANKNTLRDQPFSETKAKQRAFCFKQSYMTNLVRTYIGDYKDVEKILKNNTSFEDFITNVINKYKGKTQTELMKELNVDTNAKNINSILISRMFNVKSKLRDTDEFQKANIIPRTIRIEENGRIIESMPYPYFKYKDIINETWEESNFKEELETTKYMFFVFKKENNEYTFKGIKLWNVPQTIIDNEISKVWNKTKEVIKTGNIVKEINDNGQRETNFPGMSYNKYCHVRPHARDSKDALELPIKDKLTGASNYTKHCFWLNNKYLEEILREYTN